MLLMAAMRDSLSRLQQALRHSESPPAFTRLLNSMLCLAMALEIIQQTVHNICNDMSRSTSALDPAEMTSYEAKQCAEIICKLINDKFEFVLSVLHHKFRKGHPLATPRHKDFKGKLSLTDTVYLEKLNGLVHQCGE